MNSRKPAPGAASRVAEQLRNEILSGQLHAGERLREVDTAVRVGASRNTVREAFRMLAIHGLIEQRSFQGVTVVTLTADAVADIYAARIPIELSAVMAAPAANDPRSIRLRNAVEAAVVAAKARRWQDVLTADLHFHRHIVSFLGSQSLDEFFEHLLARLRLGLSLMEREAHGQWLEDNSTIVNLLAQGKRARAQELLAAYLRQSETALLSRVASDVTIV